MSTLDAAQRLEAAAAELSAAAMDLSRAAGADELALALDDLRVYRNLIALMPWALRRTSSQPVPMVTVIPQYGEAPFRVPAQRLASEPITPSGRAKR